MRKRLPAIVLTGMLLSLLWGGCTKDYVVHQDTPPQDSVSAPHFSEDIIPLFQRHCVSCHVPGFVLDLTPENAYEQLWTKHEIDTIEPENSNIYLRLTSQTSPMPPNGNLALDTIQIVLDWIRDGAKNN